jgi:hypothetical protein
MWMILASSVFVKTPQRIAALSLVMVLCLLVYRLAEHRLRERLSGTGQTIPSQMKQPTACSTMRWVFQCFEGSTCSTYDMDPRLRGPWCFVWTPSTSRCSRSYPTHKTVARHWFCSPSHCSPSVHLVTISPSLILPSRLSSAYA